MRVSVDQSDPGFNHAAVFCKVTLNGALLTHCLTADEELGIAICYMLDHENKLVLEGPFHEPKLETLRGVVKITPDPGYEHYFQ